MCGNSRISVICWFCSLILCRSIPNNARNNQLVSNILFLETWASNILELLEQTHFIFWLGFQKLEMWEIHIYWDLEIPFLGIFDMLVFLTVGDRLGPYQPTKLRIRRATYCRNMENNLIKTCPNPPPPPWARALALRALSIYFLAINPLIP